MFGKNFYLCYYFQCIYYLTIKLLLFYEVRSQEYFITEDVVRQKWRGLRDTFRKELSKLEQKRSGDAADETSSKWQFFDSMFFVKDQFVPRKTTGNIPNTKTQTDSTCDETEENETSGLAYSENEQSQTESNLETENEPVYVKFSHSNKRTSVEAESQLTDTPLKKKKNVRDTTMQQLLAIEKQKLSHFQHSSQQQQDDDYHFVLSLVPYIKQLPIHRKLFIRTKFQELLMHEHEALARTQDAPQAVVPRISRQYTPAPTPSPAYSSTSTEFSQQPSPVESVNDSTFTTFSHSMNTVGEDGATKSSQTATAYFSHFRPDFL